MPRKMITRDTVHVISHPKAGRTWLRLLLSLYLQGHFEIDWPKEKWLELQGLPEANSDVPHFHFTHDRNSHLKPLEAAKDKSMYADNRVIYMVRDPRDVIVSNYFQQNRREPVLRDAPAFAGSISEYVRHKQWGIAHDVGLMNQWEESRHVPRKFRLVRYEDLHLLSSAVMVGVLVFVGMRSLNLNLLQNVIEQCSFANMQALERTDALNSGRLRPTNYNDPESFKVRRGIVGGYVDYLSKADIDYVNQEMEELDDFYGYEV